MNIKEEWKEVSTNSSRKVNLALIYITLILFVFCYFGSFSFFESAFPNLVNLDYWKIIFNNCMSFILFFVFGVLFSKFLIGGKLKDYGVCVGNWKFGLKVILLATAVVPIVALSTILDGGMKATYPLIDFNTFSAWYYILIYFVSYLLYYIGFEFLFRGLGLFSLEEKFSPLTAILITTLISALIHTSIGGFGKPMIETLSAIPAGLIFGYITYKTKSIWYSLYVHMLIGFLTDIFIFFLA